MIDVPLGYTSEAKITLGSTLNEVFLQKDYQT